MVWLVRFVLGLVRSGSCKDRQCKLGFAKARKTTLATGAEAPSTVRSGMNFGPFRLARFRPVEDRPG